ncbi:ABC transporter ATP-binding protein [Catellatospora chokoriensis]|uniref:ABC transporter ATP-binding protein n=1 Tax=Catellatospora chokoriensis TaxID=310353 RepID=A0A8J3K2A7_9ACTN|nr:ABC transporter ATP-binding protein [Catellatospora chokoriensis]GIF89415.1 ABC transporter ATP-binding protein [Catellatospora chokoriensis]
MSPILTARDLTKTYGVQPALRGVDLDLHEGEIVAVRGRSGCGKSTLLHCLSGILAPDSGEVRFRGDRIDDTAEPYRSELRRTQFGVLLQHGHLISELTSAENVALPLMLGGGSRRAAMAAAATWLARLGVAEAAEQVPGRLSGGQLQRVALARAMVTQPVVLFADEPTGALDSLAGELVMKLLTRVAREQGTAVVVVTHDATVAAYAERELVLRDGEVDPTGLGVAIGVPA